MRGTQQWPPAASTADTAGGRLIGYGRVSTRDQHASLQLNTLKQAGCEPIYIDKGVSGKLASRPELDKCLAALQRDDVLVVWKLDRLGRSVQHLVAVISELRKRGVGFRSLTEALDTTTNGGMLIFHIFAAIAEFERGLIIERTMAGLDAAKAKNHHGGHPRAMTPEQEDLAMELITKGGKTVAEVARSMKVSRAAIYRAMERRGIIEPPAGESDGRVRPSTLPPETRQKALRLLKKGESVTVTAEKCGITRTSVRRIWAEADHKGPPPGAGKRRPRSDRGGRSPALAPDQDRDVHRMLRDGETPATIARVLKVDRASVYRAMDRLEQEQAGTP